MLPREVQHLVAVSRFAGDLHVRVLRHDPLQPFADHGVVVGDQHPDHRAATSAAHGMETRTLVPRPLRPVISSRPPSERTRSRIPTIPSERPSETCSAGCPLVVADRHLDGSRGVRHHHLHPRRARVARDVRERLLENAEQRRGAEGVEDDVVRLRIYAARDVGALLELPGLPLEAADRPRSSSSLGRSCEEMRRTAWTVASIAFDMAAILWPTAPGRAGATCCRPNAVQLQGGQSLSSSSWISRAMSARSCSRSTPYVLVAGLLSATGPPAWIVSRSAISPQPHVGDLQLAVRASTSSLRCLRCRERSSAISLNDDASTPISSCLVTLRPPSRLLPTRSAGGGHRRDRRNVEARARREPGQPRGQPPGPGDLAPRAGDLPAAARVPSHRAEAAPEAVIGRRFRTAVVALCQSCRRSRRRRRRALGPAPSSAGRPERVAVHHPSLGPARHRARRSWPSCLQPPQSPSRPRAGELELAVSDMAIRAGSTRMSSGVPSSGSTRAGSTTSWGRSTGSLSW